jgi:hypothetical protein
MKSVLPEELEIKRLKIKRKHTLLAFLLLCGVFGFFIIVVMVARNFDVPQNFAVIGGFLVAGLSESYGMKRLNAHDDTLCEQMGLMCPHCQKPLFSARDNDLVTGICPRCTKSIT